MPYLKTSTEWFEQSSLLLKARPTTARITSKYTVLKPSPSKIQKRKNYTSKRPQASTSPETQAPSPEEPVATFTLKTYDPVSGACLQYQTNKAAEVGRLIGSLGRLGRHMAALPEVTDDLSVPAEASGVATPVVEKDIVMGEAKSGAAGGVSGAGKKKKKGKK